MFAGVQTSICRLTFYGLCQQIGCWVGSEGTRADTSRKPVKRAARPLVCKRIEVHARPCLHCQLHTHACMLHAARYLLHAAVAVASNRQAMPSHALHVSHHSRMSHVLSHVCCLHLGGCIELIRMHRAHKHVAMSIFRNRYVCAC